MELQNTGSSTELRTLTPKIIFAPLFKAMIQTLKKRENHHFFYFTQPNGALHFETSSFISAVFTNIGLSNNGHKIYNIIKDIDLPPKDSKIRISTLLDKESEFKTSQLYRELDSCMAELIEQLMQTAPDNYRLMDLGRFLGGQNFVIDRKFPDPSQHVYETPHKLNAQPFTVQGTSKLSCLEYTTDLNPKDGVLRLFTVIEELDELKWVEKVRNAIYAKMKQTYKDNQAVMTAEDSERITEILDDECSDENNQILGLLSFIENQGLSRARSKNCFKIMELLADHVERTVTNDFARHSTVSYIRNVIAFHSIFGDQIAPWNRTENQQLESFIVDVGAIYGAAGSVDMGQMLRYVNSTDALPIWVHPKIELNDTRVQNQDGLTVKREVSYAFRVNGEFSVEDTLRTRSSKLVVNGKDHPKMLTAYEARLNSINEALLLKDIVDEKGESIGEKILAAECEHVGGRKEIFQLIMLYFVLSDEDPADFKDLFAKLVASLKDPQKIRGLFVSILEKRLNSEKTHEKIQVITQTLNTVLKSKMEPILADIEKNGSLKTAIYLESSILNTNVFSPSIFGDEDEQGHKLFKGEGHYYDYLTIVDVSRKKIAQMSEEEHQRMIDFSRKSLAQVDFKSTLIVKTLVPIKGFISECSEFQIQRDLSVPCLPVVMTPYKRVKSGENTHSYSEDALNHDDLLSMYKIMIHYTSNLFRLSALSGRQNPNCLDEKEKALIISSCCYSIATHLFMKHLIQYTNKYLDHNHKLYVPVLRIDSVDETENENRAHHQGPRRSNQKGGFNPEAKRAYATAYTFEKLLNNDSSTVKVQGLKYQPYTEENHNTFGERIYTPVNLKQDQSITYRLKASIESLSGYAPIIVPFEGTKQRVACISYSSRPENNIEFKNRFTDKELLAKTDYSYICYVYLLERINEKQGRLSLKLVNFVPVSEDNLRTSKAMHRILENLQSEGVKDVVLLSHHFAAPKIGTTEKKNLIHESESALDQLDELFPEMNFYPLQSDIVPALSLKIREKGTVYEVPHYKYQAAAINKKDFKQSLPIYCFATKKTVGIRTQNGVCTYFYMLSSQEQSIHNDKRLRLHHAMIDERDSVEMKSVRSILRGIHYFESEKPKAGLAFDPVLEPSHIGASTSIQKLGEVIISSRMNKGEIVMSLPAMIHRLEEFIVNEAKETQVSAPVAVELHQESPAKDTE